MLPPTPTHSHSLPIISIHSHPVPLIWIPLPSISTRLSPLPLILAHSYPILLLFSPLLLNLSPHPPMYSLSLTHFQSTSKCSHPIQPITYHSSPSLLPLFYVPMCFTYPYTYVPSCFTFPCANVIHFYSLYSLCLYTLRAFKRLITYTTSFRKIIVIPLSFLLQYQCFFS